VGVNARLFWILTAFFILLSVVYTVWTLLYGAQNLAQDPGAGGRTDVMPEYTGTIGLLLAGLASALIAFFVGRAHAAQGGELPEDTVNANIDDGDAATMTGHQLHGLKKPCSASLAFVFLGIAVGFWIAFIGVGFLAVSLVGWVFEYYRGYFAH
jgi:sorbitol-specific phosphotransferase system component IIC